MTIDELIAHSEGIIKYGSTDDFMEETFELIKIALAYLNAHKQGFELCCKKEITMYNFKYLPVQTELDEIIEGLDKDGNL